jgi:DNA processing protein
VIPVNEFHGPASQLLGLLNEVERRYAPDSLFGAGKLELLDRLPLVSVVGTRSPSTEGAGLAGDVSRTVVTHGGVVVSGLARGVDTLAHRAAIECGGSTIAVLGTPLNQAYPRENAALQRALMEDHLVLSQFPNGHPVQRSNFVLRNRTMALVSHGTIIVEAGEKSGTQHQGWEAIRLGRLLFIPEILLAAPFDWPRKMREYGAIVFSGCDELVELLDEFLPSSPHSEDISGVLH